MSIARNSVYNLVGAVIPVALALVTVPLYLHVVGAERYGVLTIAWLLLGYFGLFDLGLGSATTYRVAALGDAPRGEVATVFWSALAANVAIGMVGGLLLYLGAGYALAQGSSFSPTLRAESHAALVYLALAVPIATTLGVLSGALQGKQRFLEVNLISTWSTVLFQALPLIVAIAFDHRMPALLLASAVARFIGIAFLFWRCLRLFGWARRIDLGELKRLLAYGGWVTLEPVINLLLVTADRMQIGALRGAAAVAAYAIPYQVVSRLAIFPNAVAYALFPRLTSASADESEELAELCQATLHCLLGPIVVIATLASRDFFHLWLGATIGQQATLPGAILLAGFWCSCVTYLPFVSLQARNRPKILVIVHVLEMLPYFALMYLLTKTYGLAGAAAANFARAFVDMALLHHLAFKRFLQPRAHAVFGAIVALSCLVILLGPTAPSRLASAVLVGAVLIAAWLFLPPPVAAVLRRRLPMPRALAGGIGDEQAH